MAQHMGNLVPSPGFTRTARTVDDELRASTEGGFTQKGCTLAAGQGVLLLGTALAQRTSDKKYVKYASGGTGGAGVAVGILRQTTDTGLDANGPEFQGNVVVTGILVASKVAAANGGNAAAVATALGGGAKVIPALDYFKF